jgi:hypothetical protein
MSRILVRAQEKYSNKLDLVTTHPTTPYDVRSLSPVFDLLELIPEKLLKIFPITRRRVLLRVFSWDFDGAVYDAKVDSIAREELSKEMSIVGRTRLTLHRHYSPYDAR